MKKPTTFKRNPTCSCCHKRPSMTDANICSDCYNRQCDEDEADFELAVKEQAQRLYNN